MYDCAIVDAIAQLSIQLHAKYQRNCAIVNAIVLLQVQLPYHMDAIAQL